MEAAAVTLISIFAPLVGLGLLVEAFKVGSDA